MRVVFCNPPCAHKFGVDLAPPLWALVLASVAEQEGCEVDIVDLNLEVLEDPLPFQTGSSAFYDTIAARLLCHDPRLVAFSSMAVESHVALLIAQAVKRASPETLCALGGSHFGLCAQQMLEHFPWIDLVFLGEAEVSLRQVLRRLKVSSPEPAAEVDGVVFRRGEQIVTPRQAPRPENQAIPEPAYHLVELQRYFAVNPDRLLNIDAGQRGCRFNCSFCYSPAHLGRGGRDAPTERFLEAFLTAYRLGARRLFVVQDNFVNDPDKTAALCQRIEDLALPLEWTCYATLRQLTRTSIHALARAGCVGVYVGVDAVDIGSRREYAKGLYTTRLDLMERIDMCLEAGITPSLAFMFEWRSSRKDAEAMNETLMVATQGRARGCRVHFNTLTQYPGTPQFKALQSSFIVSDLKPRLIMDVPECVCDNPLSSVQPGLFPFHSTHRTARQHARLLLTTYALYTIAMNYPATLAELAERGAAWEQLGEVLLQRVDLQELLRRPDSERRAVVLDTFERAVVGHHAHLTHTLRVEQAALLLTHKTEHDTTHVEGHDGSIYSLRPHLLVSSPEGDTVLIIALAGGQVQPHTVSDAMKGFIESLSIPRQRISAAEVDVLSRIGLIERNTM